MEIIEFRGSSRFVAVYGGVSAARPLGLVGLRNPVSDIDPAPVPTVAPWSVIRRSYSTTGWSHGDRQSVFRRGEKA
jgi:hypothetical protein